MFDHANIHNEALQVLDYYKSENSRFKWYRVQTLSKLRKYKEGLEDLEALMKADPNYANNPEARDLQEELKMKK